MVHCVGLRVSALTPPVPHSTLQGTKGVENRGKKKKHKDSIARKKEKLKGRPKKRGSHKAMRDLKTDAHRKARCQEMQRDSKAKVRELIEDTKVLEHTETTHSSERLPCP